jgi:RNA:NAD 2'-phosphotransferase (TPT1/KptA family)
MRREGGFDFRRSANGVWLVEAVPAEWISWPADH